MASSTSNADDEEEFRFSSDITLEDIRASQHQFCKERNWGKFHDPRNVLLAMVGEVGELSELFQWKGEVKKGLPNFTEAEKAHVGEEISDVLIYLVDLAEQCHVDLPSAVHSKMQLNAMKYPPKLCSGSAAKSSLYGEGRMLGIPGSDIAGGSRTAQATPAGLEREEGDGSE